MHPLFVAASLIATLLAAASSIAAPPAWKRHTIDATSRGADGVRLADVNGDKRLDIVTPWEEGGLIRVYLAPLRRHLRSPWPRVTVGKVRSPEDAYFIDLDGDGNLDVISCCEGRNRTAFVHWSPPRPDLLKRDRWQTLAIPCTQKKQAWMFAVNVGTKQTPRVILGSKGRNGGVGILTVSQGRQVGRWQYQRLIRAGWIMSLVAKDMDGDGDLDVVYSDRRGPNRGVYWLQQPSNPKQPWRKHPIGGDRLEVMFLTIAQLGKEKKESILVATRNRHIAWFRTRGGKSWHYSAIRNPFQVPHGKAVAVGDINLDGRLDVVHSANNGGNRQHPGLCWLQAPANPNRAKWRAFSISGNSGVKFDLIELLDLDGDGDLDVLACEERDNLGVVWYENPTRH